MGGPHVGPPTWAQAWAQAPPDEFSDPNLTPLPTHPGIKYVARTLAATYACTCSPSLLLTGYHMGSQIGYIQIQMKAPAKCTQG